MPAKNLTPADRQRIREEAAARRRQKENKVYYTLVAITLGVIVAVFLGVTIYNAVVDARTLPKKISRLSRIQDDWLVIDTDNKLSKRYHHPASFAIPEGYSKGEFTKYNDGVAQDFYLNANDEEAPVSILYVDAASELTAEELIQRYLNLRDSALNEGTSIVSVGDAFTAELAGETAQCLYLHYHEEQGDYGVLLCAFDAPRRVCVSAQLTGAYTTPENVQTQEELLEQARTLLAGLTIVH